MNILLVPDKFKGSLTAAEVIQAVQEGLRETVPSAITFPVLASDGGEGFLDVVSHYINTSRIVCRTVDSLCRTLQAPYLFHETTKTAYIELAKASGLELLAPKERCVTETSTYGTGIQIRHALQNGAKRIYLGLGGSATNDAGTGIAAALGYTFYSVAGPIPVPAGKHLAGIIDLDRSIVKTIGEAAFFAVNDVQNPLFGSNGAAYTYGRQKGADDEQLKQLDTGLRNISALVEKKLHKNAAALPGSGAAGGAAYGLSVFLDSGFKSGAEFILGLTDFFEIIRTRNIDCIITGEGKIDEQTKNGKLIKGVTTVAARYGIPVLAVCGRLDLDKKGIAELGLKAAVEIRDPDRSDAYSFKNAAALIKDSIVTLIKDVV
ncbi:MAG: glycerate kinase [Sinomicrobium sp.]|nr:glycerate kinase [Sinomicrobium sp.]